ncbi:hypothetical protein NDA14_000205 [Ustilago hordei]|nr:hypothetical protein NDA14_000205 [Ustilago hordei]
MACGKRGATVWSVMVAFKSGSPREEKEGAEMAQSRIQRKGLTTQSGRKTRTRFTEEEEEEEDEEEDEEKETLSPTSSRVCTTTTAAVYRQPVPLAS